MRVDEPLSWGGIIGAIQDNGSYEKGWLLGFQDQRFSFALNGRGGLIALQYMAADQNFDLKVVLPVSKLRWQANAALCRWGASGAIHSAVWADSIPSPVLFMK